MLQATLKNTRTVETNYLAEQPVTKTGLIKKVSTWLDKQENNRFLWLGVALMGGIGTVVPLTLLAVVFWANNSFALWATVCIINVPVLIVNLAAQPPKITLPILFSAWFINAVIIIYSAVMYFA